MEKGSDLFKVFAPDSMASRFYVSLINQKSSVFFPISSIREGDTFLCTLADPVLCAMSNDIWNCTVSHWKSLTLCLNLSSLKTLCSKIICLMGKEDGRKKEKGKPGKLGSLNEIPS